MVIQMTLTWIAFVLFAAKCMMILVSSGWLMLAIRLTTTACTISVISYFDVYCFIATEYSQRSALICLNKQNREIVTV